MFINFDGSYNQKMERPPPQTKLIRIYIKVHVGWIRLQSAQDALKNISANSEER